MQDDDGNTDTTGLFLNLNERATCQGTAKTWHYCFHIPSDNTDPQLRAEFGVYRQQSDRYDRVTDSRRIIIVPADNPSPSCFSLNVLLPFTVLEGDVIGACILRRVPGISSGLDLLAFSTGQQLYRPPNTRLCGTFADSVHIDDFILTGAGIALQLYLEIGKPRLDQSIELLGTLVYFTLSTDSTDSPSPCTVPCQAIPNNISINADPTSFTYTTMTRTSTLLHNVGRTAITPTTTSPNPENSSDQSISSTVVHREVTPNTPPHSNQTILSTREVSQAVSDKPTSSIKHQSVMVQHSNLIMSIQTPSLVPEGNDLSESTSGLNAGSVTSILTSSIVIERGDMPTSTSSVNVGTLAGIAVAAAFLLCLALITVILVAYRRRQNHRDATKGKHKILYLYCYV